MNWIGGQLQRSKANANTLAKTQKQHFAKARLRSHNGQSSQPPFAFSIARGEYGLNTGMQDDTHIGERFRRRKRSHSQETFHGEVTHGLHSPRPRHHHKGPPDGPRRKRRRSEGALDHKHGDVAATAPKATRHLRNTAQEERPSPVSVVDHSRKSAAAEANTLQNVKRNLLNKSDWMGLAAARPLKMAFTTAEEMENIGKRKRIAEADRRSKAAAQPISRFHPAVHRRAGMNQSGSKTSKSNTEDASLRIGADLYQTQTTPLLSNKERSTPNASQSESTESMLLDKFDERASSSHQVREREDNRQSTNFQHSLAHTTSVEDDTRPAVLNSYQVSRFESSWFPGDRAHASSAEELPELETGLILPTLDELRESKNFDELKARSATRSAKGPALPLPSLPKPTRQKEVAQNSPNVDDSSLILNGRRLLPSCGKLAPPAGGDTIAEQVPTHREILRDHKATRTDLTKRSSEFWPEPVNVDIADQGSSYRPKGQANPRAELHSYTQATTADAVSASELWCQTNLREAHIPRPAFTLEQQVSDEAMAKSQLGAYQGSSLDSGHNADSMARLSSITRSNQTCTGSHARSSQYGGISPFVGRQPIGRSEAVASRDTAGYTNGSPFETLSAISTKDDCLNLQNNSVQTPSQSVSEAKLGRSGMPGLFRHAPLNGALRTRGVHPYEKWLTDAQGTAEARHSDENGALTESVIPGFTELRDSFKFEPRIRHCRANSKASNPQKTPKVGQITRVHELAGRPLATQTMPNTSPAKFIHASANTVLYRAEDLCSAQPVILSQSSETDSLTQMSPMESKLDECLTDISVYNNAARSFRRFVPAPSTNMHSGQPLQDDVDVAGAYVSGIDNIPSSQATGGAFPSTQETDRNTWRLTFPKHERLLGSRLAHRQRLQMSTEKPVVSSQPFTGTALAGRTRNLPPGNVSSSGLPRTSSPSTDLARKTRADTRALQTPRHSISTCASYYTPIRSGPPDTEPDDIRMPNLEYFNHSQAFSVQRVQGGVLDGGQRDPIAQLRPMDHESELQNGRSRDVARTHDTQASHAYPFAGEDALHILSTDSLESYGGWPTSSKASSRPGLVFRNIHTETKQPYSFQRLRPFVGIKSNRGRRDEGFESLPLLDEFGLMGRVTRRNPVVGKFNMADKPIYVEDSVADDIESELST